MDSIRISMKLTERARRNHDTLFPDHVSTLAVTDPDLIEIFDNPAQPDAQESPLRGIHVARAAQEQET